MDLGRGLDPYTTSFPIAVVGRGSPTLLPSLNRAINNGGPLNVKSPTLKCGNPVQREEIRVLVFCCDQCANDHIAWLRLKRGIQLLGSSL
jgi:hypothetical protein